MNLFSGMAYRFTVLTGLLLVLTACKGGAGNPVLGTWQSQDHQHGLIFADNGTVAVYEQEEPGKPLVRSEVLTYTVRDQHTIVYAVLDVMTLQDDGTLVDGVTHDLSYRRVQTFALR